MINGLLPFQITMFEAQRAFQRGAESDLRESKGTIGTQRCGEGCDTLSIKKRNKFMNVNRESNLNNKKKMNPIL